jgi:indole-3-glycerol phosphate synthase
MLAEIIERTVADLPELRLRQAELVGAAEAAGAPAGFEKSLRTPGLSVIAEVKRRSPSRGSIDADLDPVVQAGEYEAGGAVAISVLTEPHYFAGSPDDLVMVKKNAKVPVLRKDFMVDPIQVVQAKAMGADAILLIVACLSDADLARLLAEADGWGLDVLVEAHTSEEARRAMDCGARIVGLNNRDLSTFDVDLATAEAIAAELPNGIVRVAESGIWTVGDARRMRDAGFDAVLVGEALVRSSDPAALIRQFRT